MAADPVPGLVLDLPVDPRGSELFSQTIHHRGMVGGYPIRISDQMARTIDNVRYLTVMDSTRGAIAHDPNAPADVGLRDILPLQESFAQGLQRFGIRYVVLHTDWTYPPVYPWMRDFVEQNLGAPVYVSAGEGLVVWRVEPATEAPNVYRFTFGDGWIPGIGIFGHHQLTRMVEQDAHLEIRAPSAGIHQITIQAYAAFLPRTMVVSVNGLVVAMLHFDRPGVVKTVDLGKVELKQGANELLIHSVDGCARESDLNPHSIDYRCRSFGVTQLAISGL
jgi:hypothetical protein